MIDRSLRLTQRQFLVLTVLDRVDRARRENVGLRDARILLGLEERGMVSRNLHEEWYIRERGRQAIKAHLAKGEK